MISIIVAVAQNGVIGCGNKLIWHLPDDLKRFKRITMGHPVVMGRRTFESIGRPLPGRVNVVITRNHGFRPEGVTVAPSIDEAFGMFPDSEEIFVIGGEQIYNQTVALAERIYYTEVDQSPEGDAFFELPDPTRWKETDREEHKGFRYITYDRKSELFE